MSDMADFYNRRQADSFFCDSELDDTQFESYEDMVSKGIISEEEADMLLSREWLNK